MDHYQIRFPTNVEDVARVLYDLARESSFLRFDLLSTLSHFSASPPLDLSPSCGRANPFQTSTSPCPLLCTTPPQPRP